MLDWVFGVATGAVNLNAGGIGANDFGNSLATVYGSGTLTKHQALAIGIVFETLGAVFGSKHVGETIRKGIIDVGIFKNEPQTLMFIMMGSNASAFMWLASCTWGSVPVSTTHAIVGAILFAGMAIKGTDGVKWDINGGVGGIVISWVTSPIFSAVVGHLCYRIFDFFVIRAADPVKRMYNLFSINLFLIMFVQILFSIYKGTPQLKLDKLDVEDALLYSFLIALGVAILGQIFFVPWQKKRIKNKMARLEEIELAGQVEEIELTDTDEIELVEGHAEPAVIETDLDQIIVIPPDLGSSNLGEDNLTSDCSRSDDPHILDLTNLTGKEKLSVLNKERRSVRGSIKQKKRDQLHGHAQEIPQEAEEMAMVLQVTTIAFSAFAHGANDIPNAAGPYATTEYIWRTGEIPGEDNQMKFWIVIMCAVSLGIGGYAFGIRMMEKLGKDVTKVTPIRGAIMEFASGLTVLGFTRLGQPISSTHAQIGAEVGVGLGDGKMNVNWWEIYRFIFALVITPLMTGGICALLVSWSYYGPSDGAFCEIGNYTI
jgi:solute carrier family 20 (sodium-dependent phosphate transporter)